MAVPKKYRKIVRTATAAAGGIGIPGAFSFGADVAAMSTTWIAMILAIADKSRHKVDEGNVTEMATTLLALVACLPTPDEIGDFTSLMTDW